MVHELRDVSGKDCDEEGSCGYSYFSASLERDKAEAKDYLDYSGCKDYEVRCEWCPWWYLSLELETAGC